MKLLLDDDGNAVLRNGKPVYVDDSGKEIEVDVPLLFSKVASLNKESGDRRKEHNTLKEKVKSLDDIENLEEWVTAAKTALETVKNLDDKKLLDAGKVEELKKQINDAWDAKMLAAGKIYQEQLDTKDQTIADKDGKIYQLLVSSEFASSPYFSGENPKTTLLPDIAEAYFGKHFTVEEAEDGTLSVTGSVNGTKILSRANPGEPADFGEAMEEIINVFPMKDRILTAGDGGGSGGGGNADGGTPKDKVTKLTADYETAMKEGRANDAIALKNQIHTLNMEARGTQQ